MLGYIFRRIFLMVPTILGITFLVFMLLAMSPGGIGAALKVSNGQMEQSKAALMEAYLEDRYGLDDPAIVQYGRWLARISPIKFGVRDRVTPSGKLVRPPKELKPPPLFESWFIDLQLPDAERAAIALKHATLDASPDDPTPTITAYKLASKTYAKARAEYVVARKNFEKALTRYGEQVGIQGLIGTNGKLVFSKLIELTPNTTVSTWPNVEAGSLALLRSFHNAQAARQRELRAFTAGPYPEDGIGISGVISLAWSDLGVAFSRGRPVKDLILEALPITLLLNLVALPLIYLIAVPSGMLAARHRGSWFDIGSGAVFVAFWSIPTIWAGVMMIGYLADRQQLGWFPVSGLHGNTAAAMTFLPSKTAAGWTAGFLLDTLWHIALPVACLVYTGFAVLAKQTRAAMLENFSQDYVRTAKAKGVSDRVVTWRHVFRNSLLPLITIVVSIFPAMLAGSIVVEKIFSIPGMGSLILEAINLRDRELILANTFMIAIVNLLALLLADLLYAVADPRVTYD